MSKRWFGTGLLAVGLTVSQVGAQAPAAGAPPAAPAAPAADAKADKIKELQGQRAQLLDNIAAMEKTLAAMPAGDQRKRADEQVKKWRDKVAGLNKELAALKAPDAAATDATKPAGKQLTPEQLKEVAQIEKQIKALLAGIPARAEAIRNTPKDAPAIGAPAAAPGVVQPGMPGAPPPPGAPGAPGAMPGAMPGGPDQPGAMGVAPAMTRRQQLEQEQREDLIKLDTLRARLKELKSGPKDVTVYRYNHHEGGGTYQNQEKLRFIHALWGA